VAGFLPTAKAAASTLPAWTSGFKRTPSVNYTTAGQRICAGKPSATFTFCDELGNMPKVYQWQKGRQYPEQPVNYATPATFIGRRQPYAEACVPGRPVYSARDVNVLRTRFSQCGGRVGDLFQTTSGLFDEVVAAADAIIGQLLFRAASRLPAPPACGRRRCC